MSYPRVEIDLNDSDAHGMTLAFLADADLPLHEGRMVTAYEPEDGVSAPAMVARIDEARGVAFLWVDWKSIAKDVPHADTFRHSRIVMANSTQQSVRELPRHQIARNSNAAGYSVAAT